MKTDKDLGRGAGALDRLEIRETLERYVAATDRKDWSLMRSCFTEKPAISMSSGALAFDDREEFLAYVQGISISWSSHALSNVTIELRGDEADTIAIAISHVVSDAADSTVHVRGLRYLDHLVRAQDGWVIDRHRHEPAWQFEANGDAPQSLDSLISPALRGKNR